MFYKYNMLLLCRSVSVSYGKDSPFAAAVNDWMKWEIRVVGKSDEGAGKSCRQTRLQVTVDGGAP